MIQLIPQQAEHALLIENLLDEAFGPGRLGKSSYRLRHGVAPVAGLGLVAVDRARLVGTIRYWPVAIGGREAPALLLGPLAVATDRRGEGIGDALMRRSLELARSVGPGVVCLVGDLEYYARFGFEPGFRHGIGMPGEAMRFLVAELRPGGLAGMRGVVRRWRASDSRETASAATGRGRHRLRAA